MRIVRELIYIYIYVCVQHEIFDIVVRLYRPGEGGVC